MIVVYEYPPNFDMIKKRFPIVRGVIFAWGNKIYNPDGVHIPKELFTHEEVHGSRQGTNIEGWWEKYIEDPVFRLKEEIPAHQAEYCYVCKNQNRQSRRVALKQISKRLSSPLYGKMLSLTEAKRIIKAHTGEI